MKPEIYAKSALRVDNMQCKVGLGCDGIEIQLLSELLTDEQHVYRSVEELFNLSDFDSFRVAVVHSPICAELCGYTSIENVCNEIDYKLLDETCKLANYFGEKQKETVTVIFHSGLNAWFLNGVGIEHITLEKYLTKVLNEYHYVRIAIENVVPIRGYINNRLYLANNFEFESVEIVKHLRSVLGTDRIGTVLDTCHAALAEKYVRALYREAGWLDRMEDLTLDAFFRANKDVCFLIHLSDVKMSGLQKGEHGIPFYESTKDRCYRLLDLYNTYKYTCPITLEVSETNYLVCDGYESTKDIVDSYDWK